MQGWELATVNFAEGTLSEVFFVLSSITIYYLQVVTMLNWWIGESQKDLKSIAVLQYYILDHLSFKSLFDLIVTISLHFACGNLPACFFWVDYTSRPVVDYYLLFMISLLLINLNRKKTLNKSKNTRIQYLAKCFSRLYWRSWLNPGCSVRDKNINFIYLL